MFPYEYFTVTYLDITIFLDFHKLGLAVVTRGCINEFISTRIYRDANIESKNHSGHTYSAARSLAKLVYIFSF